MEQDLFPDGSPFTCYLKGDACGRSYTFDMPMPRKANRQEPGHPAHSLATRKHVRARIR